jgi:hypothetical protein
LIAVKRPLGWMSRVDRRLPDVLGFTDTTVNTGASAGGV